jgi:hypothetical protein
MGTHSNKLLAAAENLHARMLTTHHALSQLS